MDKHIPPFRTVTVFGGATIDRLAQTRDPPIVGASNPGAVRTLPGGVGLNVASAIARLGHPVRLVTRVGADPDAEVILSTVGAAGIDTGFVGVSPERPTATYHASFDDLGGLIIGVADMRVHDELTPAAVAAAAAQSPAEDFWLLDANLPVETIDYLVGEAASARRPVGAMAVSPAKSIKLQPVLDRLSVLFANRREAAAILGLAFDERRPGVGELAQALIAEGTRNAVISNAGEPVVVVAGREMRSFAPFRAEVRSVNGGGDALAAGVIHGLASSRGLFEAVIPGLAAAAIAVESEATVIAHLSAARVAARIGAAAETPEAAE